MKTALLSTLVFLFSAQAFASGDLSLICYDNSSRVINKKTGETQHSRITYTMDLGGDNSEAKVTLSGGMQIKGDLDLDGVVTLGSLYPPDVMDANNKPTIADVGVLEFDEKDNSIIKKVQITIKTKLGSELTILADKPSSDKSSVDGTVTFKLSNAEVGDRSKKAEAAGLDYDALTEVSPRQAAPVTCNTQYE